MSKQRTRCPHLITASLISVSPNDFDFPHSNFHDNKLESCDKPRCKRLYCFICKIHLGGEYTKEEERK